MNIILVQPIFFGNVKIEKNLDKNLKILKKVIDNYKKADIYIFPELFLGKYTNEKMKELKEIAGNKFIVSGGVKYDKGLYNSLFIISKKMEKRHDKANLWDDEYKYFKKGKIFKSHNLLGKNIALFVCADFSAPNYEPWVYNKKALDRLFSKAIKPDLIIVSSHACKKRLRDKWHYALKKASKDYNTKILFCNYKGEIIHNNFVYGGGFSGYYLNGLRKTIKPIQSKNYDIIKIKIK
jgi:predicted amidohydrolase